MTQDKELLRLEGVTKRFYCVTANDHVNLSVNRGEVHAILGENGAGKSTLMNIIYGLLTPDEGTIYYDGQPVRYDSPRKAVELGIGMVHQHFMLIPTFTVAENVALGIHKGSVRPANLGPVRQAIRELSQRFGITLDPDELVMNLSVGQQQRVEIMKMLYRGAGLLILDEPTAVLTPQEVGELFEMIRSFVREGLTVIIITHKLNEILEVADRVTIMRQGKSVGVTPVSETDENELANLMVGRMVKLEMEQVPVPEGARTVLSVENLGVRNERRLMVVKHLGLNVREGEVLGIAGVDGNGQLELMEALAGMRRAVTGCVTLLGEDITNCSPRRFTHLGGCHIPADRRNEGLLFGMSIEENILLDQFDREEFVRGGFLRKKALTQTANRLIAQFGIKAPDGRTHVNTLSGGNQQKVILARELSQSPRLILASHPTRGLDVGAIEYVHRQIIEQKKRGAAILLVSTELSELLSLSDRIAVMFKGEILGVLRREEATAERLGLMMMGKTTSEEQAYAV